MILDNLVGKKFNEIQSYNVATKQKEYFCEFTSMHQDNVMICPNLVLVTAHVLYHVH